MNTYAAVYHHRHGEDFILFKSDRDITGYYHEESSDEEIELIRKVVPDFELRHDEYVDVFVIDLTNIKTVTFD